jgi:methionyl-tRNA formyltransferase
MSNGDARSNPRLLFFGMRCAFSAPPLEALIGTGCNLQAVVLPATFRGAPPVRVREPGQGALIRLPIAGSTPGVDELANRAGLPVIEVANLSSPDVLTALRAFQPDAIAVACFPWRIPAAVRDIPRLGCLNLHPSLLPRWRGPEPLFWTFKSGDAEAGATVHLMDDGFDTGPVVKQQRVPVTAGVNGLAFERELAAIGGRLLAESVAELDSGSIAPIPQDASLATQAPTPRDEDLIVTNDQPAARIVDLVRGIVPLWGPLILRIAEMGAEVMVNGVVSFDPEESMPVPVTLSESTVRVRCRPGVALLTLAPDSTVGIR